MMPLTKRYCTDLVYQNLCCLQKRFYTDTLFPKVNSITGHKCDQIYTDGEVFFGSWLCLERQMYVCHLGIFPIRWEYQISYILIERQKKIT